MTTANRAAHSNTRTAAHAVEGSAESASAIAAAHILDAVEPHARESDLPATAARELDDEPASSTPTPNVSAAVDDATTARAPRDKEGQAARVSYAILPRTSLSEGDREAMYALMTRVYDNVTPETFAHDLANKTHVIALRSATGTWAGFSTARVTDERCGNRAVRVVFSGDTVMAPEYWGSKALQRGFLALVVQEKLLHPLQPLYWFLLSKGYKTYLLLTRNFPHSFPRVGRMPPPDERQLRDRMATALFGAAFDADAELLRYSHTDACKDRVKQGVAPITQDLLRDEDIAYFVARNPAHAAGDELVCLARIDVGLPLRFFLKRWRARAPRRFA